MGAFDKLFNFFRDRRRVRSYFKMLDGYAPVFANYDGGVYEMELTRSCIHTFASHCSKLQPNVTGADLRGIKEILERRPNLFMTGSQFLYKAATIYEAQNTVFILPILNRADETIGFYPVNPRLVEIVADDTTGEPYVRVTFESGDVAAIELARVGVVSKYLYNSDVFGETNSALDPTLKLLAMQNQGILEGIKNSASFRFMANVSNFAKSEDLKRERAKFVDENMGPDSGGLALFPNTYTNVRQIVSTPHIVDSGQMSIIQERAFIYFGTNLEILENKASAEQWAAYYEGKIEPFALQLSQAMTMMTFTSFELARGNEVVWSSNRLQYMSSTEKLQVSSQMFDRGVFSLNDVLDIWNLPHVPDGDKRYIRKEYAEITKLDEVQGISSEPEPEPPDNGGKEIADTNQ